MRVWLVAALLLASTTARADDLATLTLLTKDAPTCDAARAHCFGLQLHVAVTADGPVATPAWVTSQLAGANRHFTPIDVGWQIVGIEALPASAARIKDAPERTRLGTQVKGTVIHVFVTGQLDDIDIAGNFIYGVTWPRGDTKYVILSTAAWERTLAHELGHVFGLPHSTYPISIMNKTERTDPPLDKRTFADEEIKIMRGTLENILRTKKLVAVGK
jgi:matrixin